MMTTVELRTLRSGDYVRCISDNLLSRGIKNGELLRVVQNGTSKWERYNYADVKGEVVMAFEIYYVNCHEFEIV